MIHKHMTDKNMTESKSINSKCVCGKGLIWTNAVQIMLDPCEHIVHEKCFGSQSKCPICNTNVKKQYTHEILKKILKKKNNKSRNMYQKYVDMTSVMNFDNAYKIDNNKLFINSMDLIGILSQLPFIYGYDAGHRACKDILCLMNSRMIVNGSKYMNNKKKIYIANHTSYLDFIVIFYLFKTGFLSSAIIKKYWIGTQLLNIIPLLTVERGKDTNTVEKIRDYVKKNGSICLFPEGMISHPDTLIKFRTGAFHAGHPVQPIVIRYSPVVYDNDVNNFIKKLISDPNITINVDVLEEQYPPFDENKINNIRNKMAQAGNFALSRVSNKDITD